MKEVTSDLIVEDNMNDLKSRVIPRTGGFPRGSYPKAIVVGLTIATLMVVLSSCLAKEHNRKFKSVPTTYGRMDGFFIDDSIMDGEFLYYTYSGYLQSRAMFSNGLRNGISTSYYSNGKLWDSAFYQNGAKVGSYFVYDSLGSLNYRSFYYYGQRFGGQEFYYKNKIKRYTFTGFDHQQLYEGLYDSAGSVYKYGGELVNANLYHTKVDGDAGYGIFCYIVDPPNVDVDYTLGVIPEETNERKELTGLNNHTPFIDTLLPEPNYGWNYFIAARYTDTARGFDKVFLTVLKPTGSN